LGPNTISPRGGPATPKGFHPRVVFNRDFSFQFSDTGKNSYHRIWALFWSRAKCSLYWPLLKGGRFSRLFFSSQNSPMALHLYLGTHRGFPRRGARGEKLPSFFFLNPHGGVLTPGCLSPPPPGRPTFFGGHALHRPVFPAHLGGLVARRSSRRGGV